MRTRTVGRGPAVAALVAVAAAGCGTDPDGLTIGAAEANGGCGRPLPGEVYGTDRAVVVIGHRTIVPRGMTCALDLRRSPAACQLSRPLGHRAVFDADTGREPAAARRLHQGEPAGPLALLG